MKASFHTLGCRLNQAETAIIAKSIKNEGFEIVDFGEPADLTIINTCTVTEQADSKCRQAVRRALRKHPNTYVAVVGCYAQMAVDTLKGISGIDLIIGNEHKLKVVDYLDGLEKREEPLVVHSPKISRDEFTIESYGLYDNSTRANLKIQDGCNFVCNFCIIPTARGPARSRNPEDIQREAEKLVELGHKEIVITGVNIGTYESNEKSILDILYRLTEIENLDRIRISSIEPTTIPEDLIHFIAESPKMCKHLHIPLQSGDDNVLKSMRRKYSVREYVDFVEFVARTVPDAGIGTDVMVGYPSEDDAAFANTKKLLADLPVSYYHVFTYSDRDGTGSFKMEPKVDHHVKKNRTRILIEQGQRKKFTFYERYVGKSGSVLFEQQIENGNWVGYTSNYMNIETAFNGDLHNTIHDVEFLSAGSTSIQGKLISSD